MDMCLLQKIKRIPDPFQTKFLTQPERQLRQQKAFDKMSFLLTMIQLVTSTNRHGYLIALNRVFRIQKGREPPSKSAFGKLRAKISWRYFAGLCENLFSDFKSHRPAFAGMRIYAIDGFMMTLPGSKDIRDNGFYGRWVSSWRRGYYPKAFIVHCYDVLSGVTRAIRLNPTLNENHDAYNLIGTLEEKCLVLYDRLYFSLRLVKLHDIARSYFIARCRVNAHACVQRLLASNKKVISTIVEGRRVYFVKIKNAQSGEVSVFATNLGRALVTRNNMLNLYRLRWEVENSFREWVETACMEQWHSKTLNGVLQEFYMLLWFINLTKVITYKCTTFRNNPLSRRYRKPNFKLIFDHLAQTMPNLWYRFRRLIAEIKGLIKDSTESRKRWARSYARELKCPASPYPYNNTLWWFE